jgi:hypothetical protein
MKRIHLVFGIAAVAVFLLTGQYMAIYQGHLQGMADLPRMLFRSRHIYILAASLLNLSLGTYLTRQPRGWRRWLQFAGSVLIIAASCSLVAAFIYEPSYRDIQRTPFSFFGIIIIAAGTLAHVVAGMSDKSF